MLLFAGAAFGQAAMQEQWPADQRAYRAAMALADPQQRLTALRTFSIQFQDSRYFDSVQEAALQLLLRSFPSRTAEIRDQVQVNVANADKGYRRWQEQAAEADLLADAGVLLPLAQKLAEESVRSLTETAFLRGMARMFGELHAEMPTPQELHGQYLEVRAATLLALANVYLSEGRRARAAALLQQALHVQPRSARAHALLGEQDMAEQRPANALEHFAQAQALGELSGRQRDQLRSLYRAAHAGSDAGLEADLDRRYEALNPAGFEPGIPEVVTSGHTVLLELFTGAGCLPCAGADVAAEALLKTYPREQVVLLEWDQHIPAPDPLANPAGVGRGEVLGVDNTPNYFLDGKRMALFGATRENAAEVYAGLQRLVHQQLRRASGVHLSLSAQWEANGTVQAVADLRTDPVEGLQVTTAAENAPWPGDTVAVAERAHAEGAFPPQLVVNFALVEDHVRYSGENGIRFHRMVARATGSDPAWGQPLHSGTAESMKASFNTSDVKAALQHYLETFEEHNDQFGPMRFSSREVSLRPDSLGIVAWVQDTRTHRVVQAAYVHLNP